ncbi:M-phase phosphoprotein 8 [Entomophthora muscae]|uniref:M-phase phosphoprotein 8 n=1 Tax=Entomophthora muscae TaxID=34485 RepID=A0ACC2U7G5_9FUNG|nr:M-phase phosphoprotein 8 [Entomophthora muscae]
MGIFSPANGLRQPPTHLSKPRNQTHYQKPQYYVKWRGYPLEESTWEQFSNLTNAQEAVQLYLNKKNWKGGSLGVEGDDVRIDNSSPLEPPAQEQDLNPELGSPQAAGPMDLRTARLHFSGIKPLQADAEDDGPCSETDHTKEIIAPSGMPITAPNEGAKAATISFMSLKSAPATNQEPTQGRGTGLQSGPMTTTLEQDNQVAKLGVLTNERTPRPSTILLPLDPSTQLPQPCLS